MTKRVIETLDKTYAVPVGVSSRHVHLSKEDLHTLFGENYELTVLRSLSQKGQYAANETVDLVTEKGIIKNVRILGPIRSESQVELSKTDAIKLGLKPPIRNSGDIKNTPSIVIKKGDNIVNMSCGVIIARRHIHMSLDDAKRFNVSDGEVVHVEAQNERGGLLYNVLVRVNEQYALDFHIDTDEGNAFDLNTGDAVKLIKLI